MDELLIHLDLIENLEEAEIEIEARNNFHLRDPLEIHNDEFIKIFRINKPLFQVLLNSCEPFMESAKRATDLSTSARILLALRFFASGSYQLDIGSNWIFGVSQSSVSEVSDVLNRHEIFNRFVKFPSNLGKLNENRRRFSAEFNFPGVIGCLDCTHVAIFPPKINDNDYPEYVYINRKGYHSINVQLVCDADLKILNVNARFPGSSHDAHISNNSNLKFALQNLHTDGHTDYFLLGDSGYPLRTYLMTPVNPEPAQGTAEYLYNERHRRVRSVIERCNGVLKTRFRCLLKHRVLHYDPVRACKIINACVVLQNLCIEYNLDSNNEEEKELDLGLMDVNEDEDQGNDPI